MAKARTVHRCTECGAGSPQWTGRCPGCGDWNTLVEELRDPATTPAPVPPSFPALPIADVDTTAADAWPTGIGELDRVLSGGLVPGSVTLVGGEPGIGKSTLLLQVAAAFASRGRRALYVTAEESATQVRQRAERLGALRPKLFLAAATELTDVIAHLDAVVPDVVIVDSIQTIHHPDLVSAPGSVAQVRESAHSLVREARARNAAIVLVGHVTKDGTLAGPRVLEHVVDTVLAFEGDRHHALRMLRAAKHRFGATHELGLFEMTDMGLVDVPDASGLFLADRQLGRPGSAVVAALEGHRPVLVEVQALVAPGGGGSPRRSAQGIDAGRLAVILAVLGQHAGVNVATEEVYALAVGGLRVVEPAADLAIALAVTSARYQVPLRDDLVVCAELGLGGELRQVAQTNRRLAEAARLGFRAAVVARHAPEPPPGIDAFRAANIVEAWDFAAHN